jgi:hypothetical protein
MVPSYQTASIRGKDEGAVAIPATGAHGGNGGCLAGTGQQKRRLPCLAATEQAAVACRVGQVPSLRPGMCLHPRGSFGESRTNADILVGSRIGAL